MDIAKKILNVFRPRAKARSASDEFIRAIREQEARLAFLESPVGKAAQLRELVEQVEAEYREGLENAKTTIELLDGFTDRLGEGLPLLSVAERESLRVFRGELAAKLAV